MIRVNHTSRIALDRGDVVDLPDPAGRTVFCRAGVLWLTIDDEPADIVLEAGQCFEATGHRRLLVSALAAARFDVIVTESRTRLTMARPGVGVRPSIRKDCGSTRPGTGDSLSPT